MNTEFIQSLMQTVGYPNCRILSESFSLREKAMSIRKATEVLPVDISVKIAADVLVPLCEGVYPKILGTAILLHIKENSTNFPIVELNDVRDGIVSHVSTRRIPRVLGDVHFSVDEDVGFLYSAITLAALEILDSPMGARVKEYLDVENVVCAIFQSTCFHMYMEVVWAALTEIAPNACEILQNVSVAHSETQTVSVYEVVYNYITDYSDVYRFHA